ncbi:coiled-coil domain-containing protein [Oopsacas minuta]|uniref:Vacuolar ATPase assembly protein VMA22 n=1 Tax=Oopsacas minuta TaxID=111878 RepID=A0AAV7KI75_9METZ|nr:coiled-coil domain-containing protein [Oopsacas minuta]
MVTLGSDTTLESIDRLTLDYLAILEEIAVSKQQLESVLHEGFQNLSHTRLVLGQTAISPLSYNNVMEPTALITYEKVDDSISFDLEIGHGNKIVSESNNETKNSKQSQSSKTSSASDPIRWFAALPPHSLRSARSNFQKSLVVITHLATLQSRAESFRKQIHFPSTQ